MRHRSARPDRKYAAVPNAAMRDNDLSIEARGLLALLMTYADNWTFRRDHLMAVAGVGKDKFGRMMRELIDAGYVSTTYIRDGVGHISGRTWLINDDPAVVRKTRTTVAPMVRKNRCPENPASGESAHIRKPTDKKTNNTRRPRSSSSSLKIEDPVSILSEVVSADLARDYAQQRSEMEFPLTVSAAKRMAEKLRTFPDPAGSVNAAICGGYLDVYLTQDTRNEERERRNVLRLSAELAKRRQA